MAYTLDGFRNIWANDEAELNGIMVDAHKQGIECNLEAVINILDSALAKANLILNRKGLRESLSQDEQINTGVFRNKLEKFIDEVKALKDSSYGSNRI